MLRSLVAVVGGYLVIGIMIMVLFVLAPRPAAMPDRQLMVLSVLVSTVAAVIGGYITALIAGRRELQHAVALAAMFVVLETVRAAVSTTGEPVWYRLATLLAVVFGVLLGSGLRIARRARAERRRAARSSAA